MDFWTRIVVRIHVTNPLFAQDVFKGSPSLKAICDFVEAICDDRLSAGLRGRPSQGTQ
jgi:hypothetical protein